MLATQRRKRNVFTKDGEVVPCFLHRGWVESAVWFYRSVSGEEAEELKILELIGWVEDAVEVAQVRGCCEYEHLGVIGVGDGGLYGFVSDLGIKAGG